MAEIDYLTRDKLPTAFQRYISFEDDSPIGCYGFDFGALPDGGLVCIVSFKPGGVFKLLPRVETRVGFVVHGDWRGYLGALKERAKRDNGVYLPSVWADLGLNSDEHERRLSQMLAEV